MKWLAIASIAAIAVLVAWSSGEKWWWDRQVRELCAKDGGIKVYETVNLPAENFDQWGMVKSYRPTQGANALGPEYAFKEDSYTYRKGNPQMSRTHYQIFRRSDGKLLGETVLYGRGGGDVPIPLPMHPTSFHCPDPNEAGDVTLLKKIFVMSSRGDK